MVSHVTVSPGNTMSQSPTSSHTRGEDRDVGRQILTVIHAALMAEESWKINLLLLCKLGRSLGLCRQMLPLT